MIDPKKVGYYVPVLGADPEFFYVSLKGNPVPANKILPNKHCKRSAGEGGGFLFFNGFQAKMHVLEGSCRDGLNSRLRRILEQATKEGKNRSILIKPALHVSRKILDTADPKALTSGCSPDLDAYKKGTENFEEIDKTHLIRYASGHIHIGHGVYGGNKYGIPRFMKSKKGILSFIQLCDVIIGIPMVILDREEGSATRRLHYGKAGSYKTADYGIEYRVPSNFWLASPLLSSAMFGFAKLAFRVMCNKLEDEFFKLVDMNKVRYAIDFNDFKTAVAIYKKIKDNLIAVSVGNYDVFSPSYVKYFDIIIKEGLGEVVNTILSKEWSLPIKNHGFSRNGYCSILNSVWKDRKK